MAVSVEFNANDGQLSSALDKIITKMNRLEETVKKQDKAQGEAFGKAAVDRIGAYAMSFVGIQNAINGIADAYRRQREEAESAANAIKASVDAMKLIVQVSDTPAEQLRLKQFATQLSTSQGIPYEQALRVQAALKSTDLLAYQNLFGGVSRFADPQIMAESTQRFVTNFPTQTPASVVSMMATAAGPSNVYLQDIARATSGFAYLSKEVGSSPAETLALTAEVGKGLKSVERAETGIRAVMTELRRSGYTEAGGVLPGLAEWQRTDPEGLQKALLSREEFSTGFYAIRDNYANIVSAIPRIEASGRSLEGLATRLQMEEADPELFGARMVATQEAQYEAVKREMYGEEMLFQQEFSAFRRKRALETGVHPVARAFDEFIEGWRLFFDPTDTSRPVVATEPTKRAYDEFMQLRGGSLQEAGAVESLNKIHDEIRRQNGVSLAPPGTPGTQ